MPTALRGYDGEPILPTDMEFTDLIHAHWRGVGMAPNTSNVFDVELTYLGANEK